MGEKFRWRLSLGEVALLLLFVILFLPSFLTIYHQELSAAYSINSLLWRIIFYKDGSLIAEPSLYIIAVLPYIFLKYLLIYQMIRYYRFLTTKKRVMILGILSEVQSFIMLDLVKMISILVGFTEITWSGTTWSIPVPFVLITCSLLLVLAPRTDSEQLWITEDNEKEWWNG